MAGSIPDISSDQNAKTLAFSHRRVVRFILNFGSMSVQTATVLVGSSASISCLHFPSGLGLGVPSGLVSKSSMVISMALSFLFFKRSSSVIAFFLTLFSFLVCGLEYSTGFRHAGYFKPVK